MRRLSLSEFRQFAPIYIVSNRIKEYNARTLVPKSFLSLRAESSDSWARDQNTLNHLVR